MKTTLMLLTLVLTLGAAAASAETFEGELSSSDPTRPESGQYFDTYTFEAQAGQLVTVRMESDSFDTYLIVESPSGGTFENDDYSGGSQLDLLVSDSGEWTIKASSYGSDTSGAYTVTVEEGRVGKIEKKDGRLDAKDEMTIKGEYYDVHEMQVRPGTQVYVELVSLGFDGYLAIRAPSGELWRRDVVMATSSELVGPLEGETGNWTIYVTTASEEEVGAYDLSIVRFE